MRPSGGSQKSDTFLGSLIAAALVAAIFMLAPPAHAGGHCRFSSRDEVAAILAERYGEAPIATADTVGGGSLEVFASEGGATWTVIVWFEEWGQVCFIESGGKWKSIPFKIPESFKPAGVAI